VFGLGVPELLIILLILLILFGGTRVARLGGGLGEAIGSFRQGLSHSVRTPRRHAASLRTSDRDSKVGPPDSPPASPSAVEQ